MSDHPNGEAGENDDGENVQSTICRTMNVAGQPLPGAPEPEVRTTIPGYQLLERIGAGGYGEVWRALAPGGLEKAVKVVYGNIGDARADTELKSLERVKHARHPFLLVLERFEIVEGRLVVVTELAEGSLKDTYDEYHAAGKPGIPRGELLKYVRDAADALDFMYEKHGLAHLDVKPENILLVGDHAKVADFGLTQSLGEERLSGMGGLTPQFAAPEVFEGRPSKQSDQYSLAIMYQMLLTGQPPFNGRTAAQLTAQHMHSAPQLSSLPPSDRPAISRALSKNPSLRFGSCVEMVESLMERATSRTPKAVRPSRSSRAQMTVPTDDVAAQISSRFGNPPLAVKDHVLPPADVTAEATPKPTLVVGLGGFGGRVLQALHGLRDELDPDTTAERLFYIDTDATAVNQFGERCGGEAVGALAIPLRAASHYRRNAKRWLEWIDRRWLYNVPRSLRTEGIRALGRLACVDNEMLIRERLALALGDVPPGTEESPTVVQLVTSSSGGTGSGTLLDVVRILVSLAEELERPIEVRILLVHLGRGKETRDGVALANTVSLLAELRSVLADQLARTADGLDLPNSISDVSFADASDSGSTAKSPAELEAALLLHHAFRSPASPVLDADRRVNGRKGVGVCIGCWGVAALGDARGRQVTELAERFANDVRSRWLAAPGGAAMTAIEHVIGECLSRTELAADRIEGFVAALTDSTPANEIAGDMIGRAANDSKEFVRLATSLDEAESRPQFVEAVGRLLADKCRELFETVAKAVARAVSEPGARFGSGTAVVERAKRSLRASQRVVETLRDSAGRRIAEGRTTLLAKSKTKTDVATTLVVSHLTLVIARELDGVLSKVDEQLDGLASRIEEMRQRFLDVARGDVPAESVAAEPTGERLLDELDRRIQRELQSRDLLFGPACASRPRTVAALVRRVARILAEECALHGDLQSRGPRELLTSALAQATPRHDLHGILRRFIAVPSRGLADGLAKLAAAEKMEETFVVDPRSPSAAIQLIGGIPLGHVVGKLIGQRSDILSLADRLHTRVDVDWRA